jgi:tRNA pseudouridine38-40 synthase
MARYKLILAYDGTDFAGSQRQAGRRTVQGELEKALRGLGWSDRSLVLAGRTDTGVHASNQVAAFDLEWIHSPDALRDALNACLPWDMAAQSVEVADAEFHPRFDATSRRYRYRVFCRPVRDPLSERFAWRVWPAVDGPALTEIAETFIGRHDYSAFGSAPRPEGNTVRTVTVSQWKRLDTGLQYDIEADAFLYRMVRRLVYVQVAVAQGRCLTESVAAALIGSRHNHKCPAGLAPAHGLSLVAVDYST